MIVNSTMNQIQMDTTQSENFYLKRKLDMNDSIDNGHIYVQPKKRHIQYFSADENYHQNLINSQQNDQNCELQFHLNNNNFINECHTIEFLNYENNLAPMQTTIFSANERFDTTNWQNSDLLELDQKYNSVNVSNCFDKQHEIHTQNDLQHQETDLHQNHHHLQLNDLQNQSEQIINGQDTLEHKVNNSQADADFEDKNLSWLFNFKLDELPHLSPEIQNSKKVTVNNVNQTKSSKSSSQSKTGKKVDELIKEVTSEMTEENEIILEEATIVLENNLLPIRTPKKPPFTYTELIEYALEEKGELTVSGIYQWISDRFPFYKSNDDRWKNSVRHNLSINPHFRKGAKAPQGAGHLWTISSRDSEENALAWEHKKQRLELFFKMEEMHNQKYQNATNQPVKFENSENNNLPIILDEAAIAAHHISQEMKADPISPGSRLCHSPLSDRNSCLPMDGLIHEEDLKRTAGEILNGVRRTVEVQPINSRTISTYHDSLLETEDYLNPITKDDAVSESGLRNHFYLTEIVPSELGINMTHVEEEVLFSEEFNLNYFGISSGSDIVA